MIYWADIWIAVLSGCGIAMAAGLVLGLVGPVSMRPLRKVSPGVRSVILVLSALAPVIAGILGAKLVAWSPHALPFDLVSHHCHADLAICSSHARAENTVLLIALGAGTLGALIVWIAHSLFDLVSQSTQSQRLLRAASSLRNGRASRLVTDRIVAVSAGLLRPRIFLSEGLVKRLDRSDVEVVIAHEAAHGQRRDSIIRLLVSVFSLGHLPHMKTRLLAELELAQEQICDRAAAKAFGAVPTAETLLKVERLRHSLGGESLPLSTAFDHSDIEARTRALVAPDFGLTRPAVIIFSCLLMIGALALLVAAEPVHHEIESFFLSLQN